MKFTSIGATTALAMVIAAGIAGLMTGCEASHSSEYREYAQLDGSSTTTDVSSARDNSAAAADVESPPAAASSPAGDMAVPANEEEPGAASTHAAPASDATQAASPAGEAPADQDAIAIASASPDGSTVPAATNSEPQPAADPATAVVTTVAPSNADPAVPAATDAASSVTRGAQPGSPVPAPADPAAPRKVEVLVKNRDFKTEGPEKAIRVSYDDIDLLKVLNMEPVTPDAPRLMPDWLKSLDGRRIRIRGFMYPNELESGIEHFILARDNQICCFGRNPKIYDVFWIHVREGETTHYILGRPFDVVGVFHIQPIVEEGTIYQLYVMDDAIVIE